MQDIPQNIPRSQGPFIISKCQALCSWQHTPSSCRLRAKSVRDQQRRGEIQKGKGKKDTASVLPHYSWTVFHCRGEILLKTLTSTLKIQILLGLPTEFPNQPPHTEPKHRSLPASSTKTHRELFPHNINAPVSKNANFPPLFCASPAGAQWVLKGSHCLFLNAQRTSVRPSWKKICWKF